MSSPFFSIIIPCYNVMTFIDRTLKALEEQSFTDFEVVCIDDCSTDGTYDYLLQKAANSIITINVYRNEVNKGPGVSRNVGIARAKGRYIGFCDGDDWLEKNALEIIHRKLDEYQSPVDIVFFNLFQVFPSGKKRRMNITSVFDLVLDTQDRVAASPDQLWCLFVSRVLLTKVPVVDLRHAEDMVMVPLLMIKAARIAYLDDALYNYRYRTSSASTTISLKVVVRFEDAFKFLMENMGSDYRTALEFLCIKLIIYGLLYNAVRCKLDNRKLKEKISMFEREFPLWFNNRYIGLLPLRKRIWILFAKHRLFLCLRLYCNIQLLYFRISSI